MPTTNRRTSTNSRCAGRVYGIALVAIITAVHLLTPAAWAIRLDETALFIEINDTDGDAGIQIFLDAEGWEKMQVLDPMGRVVVDIDARHAAQMQGMTEGFFESAEPSFDDQPLDEFLALWPEGTYKFRGRTKEGVPLRGRAELTHALPAAPLLILPVPDDEEVDPEDVVIQWQGVPDPPGSRIILYEVILGTDDDGPFRELRLLVSPDRDRVSVPPEFMAAGRAYKYEVLAKEASGNQTISEAPFATVGFMSGDDDDDDDNGDDG